MRHKNVENYKHTMTQKLKMKCLEQKWLEHKRTIRYLNTQIKNHTQNETQAWY